MVKSLWIAILLVVTQSVHSYILLTANIDDLRNIGERVVQSPIGQKVSNIVRRAYNVFNNNLSKKRTMRAEDDDIVLAYKPDDDSMSQRKQGDLRDGSDLDSNENASETFSALGKSASVYLQKIKKIFENA